MEGKWKEYVCLESVHIVWTYHIALAIVFPVFGSRMNHSRRKPFLPDANVQVSTSITLFLQILEGKTMPLLPSTSDSQFTRSFPFWF